jgi:hypothetical protein
VSTYYDRSGQPMEMMEWVRAFEDIDDRVVDFTLAADGGEVSTVWLGLDHSFGAGPPLIFETMVFGGPSTEEEAKAGHAAMVERCGGEREVFAPTE